MSHSYVLETIEAPLAILQLNHSKASYSLSLALMGELLERLYALQNNSEVRCIILTGTNKAFAVGADIKEMHGVSMSELKQRNQFLTWDQIPRLSKPLIAAVQGFALGGGCELAMSCDLIIAADDTQFAQPEINLGAMPGAGGTQRLTKILGKARAMEYLLTGKHFSAEEALEWGLINKVVPNEQVLAEAKRLALEIASKAPIAVSLIKESVYKALDTPTQVGMDFERNSFYMCFGTRDCQEGITAFLEKRKPYFKGY